MKTDIGNAVFDTALSLWGADRDNQSYIVWSYGG